VSGLAVRVDVAGKPPISALVSIIPSEKSWKKSNTLGPEECRMQIQDKINPE
jgi:hypothetical protein